MDWGEAEKLGLVNRAGGEVGCGGGGGGGMEVLEYCVPVEMIGLVLPGIGGCGICCGGRVPVGRT